MAAILSRPQCVKRGHVTRVTVQTYMFIFTAVIPTWHIIHTRSIDHRGNISDSDSDSDRILFNINTYWDRYIRLQNKHGGTSKIDQKPDMVNMHVGRPLLRSCLTAYIEATLGESTWPRVSNILMTINVLYIISANSHTNKKNHSSTCHM